MQGQILGEMRRGGRLPRPALKIHDRNYLHVLRTGAMRQVAARAARTVIERAAEIRDVLD